jgi:hypothetical protein
LSRSGTNGLTTIGEKAATRLARSIAALASGTNLLKPVSKHKL